MSLLHPQRFVAPPETISDLRRADHHWHLVRGRVLGPAASGNRALPLPYELPAPHAVLARVDLEQHASYARDRLRTLERGTDFFIADEAPRDDRDGSHAALVRVADDLGHLHPDVELHLGTPFAEVTLPDDGLTAFLRRVSVGDPIYVLGRVRYELRHEMAGMRAAPLLPCFSGELGPVHLYDEPAFPGLAAWYALPWYRKLSLLVRNR